MIFAQDIVDLLLAVTLANIERFGNIPQNSIQFFALSRDSLQAAVRTGVVSDDLAVIGIHVHIRNGGGHFLLRKQTARFFLQRLLVKLIDVVVAVRFGADQPNLGELGKVMRYRGWFQVEQCGEFLHAVGLLCQQPDDLEAVRIRKSFEKSDKLFAHVTPRGFWH